MQKTFNFSAGPAMLPVEVMKQAQAEFTDFYYGMSAMEISHRHSRFTELMEELNANLIKLLNIPKNYKILWTTGGATLQFSMLPLNLAGGGFNKTNNNKKKIIADYLCTGHWSAKSADVAEKYIDINRIVSPSPDSVFSQQSYLSELSARPLYLYYTPNETISGLRFNYIPDTSLYLNNPPLVADMTSCILSEPIDVAKFGVIFASSQKNIGLGGLTLVIVRDDLLKENVDIPDITSYKLLAEHNSILNTPPTYNFYMINLVLIWLLKQGGLAEIYKNNLKKSNKLYSFIDSSQHYVNKIKPDYRSLMNVVFAIKNNESHKNIEQIEQEFITKAQESFLYNLAGHRSIGGFRASLYNAMPEEGVDALISFMQEFEEYLTRK